MSDDSPANRAPYLTPEQRPDFEKKIKGQCHCGQIVYWLNQEKPLAAKYCHCSDCKTIHGAPVQWAAIFEKSHLSFEKGMKGLRFYNSSLKQATYQLPCKASCDTCGSSILDEGRNMVLMFPTLLRLPTEELRKVFDVQCHIFYPQSVIDVADDKPKWEGLDKSSKLLEEHCMHEHK